MPYRSASITCIRHPLTAASSSCSVCGHEVCGECGSWLALRFRCLDCAARYRRWRKFSGRLGRVALLVPLIASLFGAGAIAMTRPTPRHLVSLELPDVKLQGCHSTWAKVAKDQYQQVVECY
jgi:hypothetical protein